MCICILISNFYVFLSHEHYTGYVKGHILKQKFFLNIAEALRQEGRASHVCPVITNVNRQALWQSVGTAGKDPLMPNSWRKAVCESVCLFGGRYN